MLSLPATFDPLRCLLDQNLEKQLNRVKMEKAAAVAEVKELEEQLGATQAELAVAKRNVTKAAANSPSSGLIAELEASQALQVHQLRPFVNELNNLHAWNHGPGEMHVRDCACVV